LSAAEKGEMSKPERQKNAKEAIERVELCHFQEYDAHAPAVGCAGLMIC
jgi:hypothetical protein